MLLFYTPMPSFMILTPWAMWDPYTGKPTANPRTFDT